MKELARAILQQPKAHLQLLDRFWIIEETQQQQKNKNTNRNCWEDFMFLTHTKILALGASEI